ncbi:tetratricopeptide TPR_2 [Geminocystis sp. NIES-3708]|nr:tetratricopeptide TPR_2 [Geminocystis sp. NIES-3708]
MNISEYEIRIKSFFEEEKYEQAIEYIENILVDNSEINLYKTYLGLAYFCQGNEEFYQTILLDLCFNAEEEDFAIIAELIFNIAELKSEQTNINLAIKLYQQVLEINPQYILAYINLAQLFSQQSNFDDAVYFLEELISIKPNFIITYEKLGLLWQNINEFEKAIIVYSQGLKIQENNLNILSNLAYCYLKNNNFFDAKEILLKVIKIEPKIYQSYGELGYIYLLENNLNLTIKLWTELIDNLPLFFEKYLDWYHNNLQNLSINNEVIKLNINLVNSLKNRQNQEGIAFNIANLLFQQKNYLLAINYYQIALNQNLELESIYYNLILSLLYTQQRDKIASYLDKLSSINLHKSQLIFDLINHRKSNDKDNKNLVTSPHNYHKTALNFVEKNQIIKTNYYDFNLDNILKLKPPKTLDKNIHPSFYFSSIIELPKTFLVNIPDGRFYLREDEASSAIITKENYIIGELSPESPALSPNHPDSHPSNHSIFKTNFLPSIQLIKGTVIILAGLANDIYFHWLFDILPRIKLLELAKINYREIDYFLVDNRTNFQKETLEIFGIPHDKILPLSFPLHIQAENLIVPSFPSTIAWMPPWSCDYLRNKILDNKDIQNQERKRLYISRKNSSNRRLINEDEVVNILLNYNFEIVNLEFLSVKKQGELLSTAEIVVSSHGSGLSNLVFCQPNTKVIEIFAPNYVYPCYWLVSNLINLDYYYLIGEIIGSKHFHQLLYPDSRLEDIYLNCQNLQQLLNKVI